MPRLRAGWKPSGAAAVPDSQLQPGHRDYFNRYINHHFVVGNLTKYIIPEVR